MRLIDADELKKHIGTYDGTTAQVEAVEVQYIDNAPTVDTYTEDDVQYAIKEGHQVGYEMAKAKFGRPQEVNCSHCDYFKFSKSFIENVVKVMTDYNIETVEDLMKELNHINEWLGGRE